MLETTLYSDSYWTVFHDAPNELVRVKRSSTSYETLTDAEASFHAMKLVLLRNGFASHRLLIDSRDAPGRNDPEFEKLTARFRDEIRNSFSRKVMLLRTVVGRMQVERMVREGGAPISEIYTDEAEAYRALGVSSR